MTRAKAYPLAETCIQRLYNTIIDPRIQRNELICAPTTEDEVTWITYFYERVPEATAYDDRLIAVTHHKVRQDGTIDCSGKRDPKRIVLKDRHYTLNEKRRRRHQPRPSSAP